MTPRRSARRRLGGDPRSRRPGRRHHDLRRDSGDRMAAVRGGEPRRRRLWGLQVVDVAARERLPVGLRRCAGERRAPQRRLVRRRGRPRQLLRPTAATREQRASTGRLTRVVLVGGHPAPAPSCARRCRGRRIASTAPESLRRSAEDDCAPPGISTTTRPTSIACSTSCAGVRRLRLSAASGDGRSQPAGSRCRTPAERATSRPWEMRSAPSSRARRRPGPASVMAISPTAVDGLRASRVSPVGVDFADRLRSAENAPVARRELAQAATTVVKQPTGLRVASPT